MSVTRINKDGLTRILNGETQRPGRCVVKFYSNNCHLCHNLKDYYEEVSNSYDEENLYFYAFNVQDSPKIDVQLGFSGVPTIVMIKVGEPNRTPAVKQLMEPDTPNEDTWYSVKDIKDFIEKEK